MLTAVQPSLQLANLVAPLPSFKQAEVAAGHDQHVQRSACTGTATHNMAPTCPQVRHMFPSPAQSVNPEP